MRRTQPMSFDGLIAVRTANIGAVQLSSKDSEVPQSVSRSLRLYDQLIDSCLWPDTARVAVMMANRGIAWTPVCELRKLVA